ncbi:hypothetical protein ACB092_05G150100 [Castanea dentata]
MLTLIKQFLSWSEALAILDSYHILALSNIASLCEDFGAWLLFKAFDAAKLTSVN